MEGIDRISGLAGGIVYKILVLLPIQEAVKIVVLSNFYKDMKFNLAQLDFNDYFFGYMYEKCSKETTKKMKRTRDISADFYIINKVLLQHNSLIVNLSSCVHMRRHESLGLGLITSIKCFFLSHKRVLKESTLGLSYMNMCTVCGIAYFLTAHGISYIIVSPLLEVKNAPCCTMLTS